MQAQYGPPPMPPLGAFYPSGYPPMMPPPPPELFQPPLYQLQTYSMDSLNQYPEVEDPNRAISPQQGSQRSRRRHPPGSENVKHRRTRSGCYTCRQRRVKCDEGQPVCERCRKGKRDCSYPGLSPKKSNRTGSKSKTSSADGASTSSDESDADEMEGLPSIADDEEDLVNHESEPSSATTDKRNYSDTSLFPTDKSETPATETSSGSHRPPRPQASRTNSKQSVKAGIFQNSRWAALPKDVKMYLKYHRDCLTHHHYAFKYDSGEFLKTTFLEIALNDQSQALLYAIVAFSAYHRTLEQDSRMSHFLTYYNKSIVLLQQSLKSKKPGVTTLLTILQLATIEEFLGDWVNLLGHQRAAYQILTDLFTPQTITHDETRRKIINWYIRFDLFAGIMSGGATSLGRDWFASCLGFYQRQVMDRPDDLGAKFEEYFATSRLLATDVTLLLAAKSKDNISDDEFGTRCTDLLDQHASFESVLQSVFASQASYIQDFPKAPPFTDADITDFRDPDFLYSDELFTMNFVMIDFWAIDLMFKHHLMSFRRGASPAGLTELALKQCKMFEAIQYCSQSPPGAIMGCQASLGIASLFLPKNKKHIGWCRRKFAIIEQKGYIYPSALRERMSGVWGVDVDHWWLPNDEGYPAIVRSIRDFIEYRARVPAGTMDSQVQNMSGLFRGLDVEDDSLDGSHKGHSSPELDRSTSYETTPEHS